MIRPVAFIPRGPDGLFTKKGLFMMMISKKMNGKLNEQIAVEFSASHAYLAMVCAYDAMGLKVLAQHFERQSAEEREHGMKIIHYLHEVSGHVALEQIDKPVQSYKDAESIVVAALAAEQNVTKMVHDLVELADEEKDYATRSFLQWFVDEQVEEVSSMNSLLTLVRLAQGNMLQVEARLRHEMSAKS